MKARHFSINKLLLFLLAFPFLSYGQEIGDSTIFKITTNLIENQKVTKLDQNKSSSLTIIYSIVSEQIIGLLEDDIQEFPVKMKK